MLDSGLGAVNKDVCTLLVCRMLMSSRRRWSQWLLLLWGLLSSNLLFLAWLGVVALRLVFVCGKCVGVGGTPLFFAHAERA